MITGLYSKKPIETKKSIAKQRDLTGFGDRILTLSLNAYKCDIKLFISCKLDSVSYGQDIRWELRQVLYPVTYHGETYRDRTLCLAS